MIMIYFVGADLPRGVGAARSAMRGIGQASRRPPRGKGAPPKAVKQLIINAAWYYLIPIPTAFATPRAADGWVVEVRYRDAARRARSLTIPAPP